MDNGLTDAGLVDWLLDSDPALRWQVERDLVRAPEDVWQATRARVNSEGFGAELLARQDPDGQWAGGAFFPAAFDFSTIDAAGQPWTATTWSLTFLREWGVDAAVLGDTADRLAVSSRWEYDDLPYWGGEVDACINSWTLSNGLWLGVDMDPLADWFIEHRMADGGWNCEWVNGATRSSFHSTLNALKGLLDYARQVDAERVAESRRSGAEYLLERHLFKKRSTGEVVGEWALSERYPFKWVYSALNAADHFRQASLFDGTPPDPRMAEAIEHIRAARQSDGTWLQQGRLKGAMWFEIDVPKGEPSKWLTLIGTRVLGWWDQAANT